MHKSHYTRLSEGELCYARSSVFLKTYCCHFPAEERNIFFTNTRGGRASQCSQAGLDFWKQRMTIWSSNHPVDGTKKSKREENFVHVLLRSTVYCNYRRAGWLAQLSLVTCTVFMGHNSINMACTVSKLVQQGKEYDLSCHFVNCYLHATSHFSFGGRPIGMQKFKKTLASCPYLLWPSQAQHRRRGVQKICRGGHCADHSHAEVILTDYAITRSRADIASLHTFATHANPHQ